MNKVLAFRPYSFTVVGLFVIIGFETLSFIGVGIALAEFGLEKNLDFLAVMVMCGTMFLILREVITDVTNWVIYFEKEGVRIAGGKPKNYRYFSWDTWSYVCCIYNYKGQPYAVLSPTLLSEKQLKSLHRHIIVSHKLCVGSILLIPLAWSQDVTQVKLMLAEHGFCLPNDRPGNSLR